MPTPVTDAAQGGERAERRSAGARRALLVVACAALAAVAGPRSALDAQLPPPAPAAGAQRPAAAAADSAAASAADTTRQGASDASRVADPAATGGSPAATAVPADSAQRAAAALRRQVDSLRAASLRRGLLGDLSLVEAIIAIALATLAVLLGLGALQLFERYGEMVRRDESLGITSHWGGFGGGASGWRASPALALLVGAVLLLGGATTVAVSVVSRVLPSEAADATPPNAKDAAPRP